MVSWKPLRNSVTTNLGTYMTLSSIWDGAFGENIYRLKVVNYFRKKISILDVLEGAKYASGRRMKAARYVSLYLLSGITVLSPVSLCFLKVKKSKSITSPEISSIILCIQSSSFDCFFSPDCSPPVRSSLIDV